MADCVYKYVSGTLFIGCTSKKHPAYDKKQGRTPLKANCPDACRNGGKGCPVFAKEMGKKKKK